MSGRVSSRIKGIWLAGRIWLSASQIWGIVAVRDRDPESLPLRHNVQCMNGGAGESLNGAGHMRNHGDHFCPTAVSGEDPRSRILSSIRLKEYFSYVEGCDIGEELIEPVRDNYPDLHFTVSRQKFLRPGKPLI
jgi:hypothetical protein